MKLSGVRDGRCVESKSSGEGIKVFGPSFKPCAVSWRSA